MPYKTPLTKEKETLFITLCAKALDFRSKTSILNDNTANKIVESTGVDISKYASSSNRINVVRAKHFDEWTNAFIAKNQTAVVVYLGCGLDTRITRIQPSSQVTWYDVDYPEVIDLRKAYYSETTEYKMLGSSITMQDWLDEIPANRPVLIVAEGVLEYLTEEEVKNLFSRLTSHFSTGQIIFDVMNSFAIKSSRKKLQKTTGATLNWAVDNASEIDKMDPKMKIAEAVPIFRSRYMKKVPFAFRIILRLASILPKYKNIIQLIRCEF